MRKVITIILLSLLVIASVSASAIHSLNFAYSVHEGSHIGIDYSGSSTSPVHVYGGIYGLFALGNARPGVTAGIYLGPGFSIPLNENRSLLLQLAAAVDIPMCFDKSTIGTGIGVIADIGLKWRFSSGLLSDGIFLSAGVKGGYYFGYLNMDLSNIGDLDSIANEDKLMRYRITPYLGLGFAF